MYLRRPVSSDPDDELLKLTLRPLVDDFPFRDTPDGEGFEAALSLRTMEVPTLRCGVASALPRITKVTKEARRLLVWKSGSVIADNKLFLSDVYVIQRYLDIVRICV